MDCLMTDIDAALGYVDEFEENGGSNIAWKLDRYWTLQRIRKLVKDPQLIHQHGLNACGPAVFFRVWFSRDPLSAATFACEMLRDGASHVGTLAVAAGWKLKDQDYALLKSTTNAAHPGATPENADWMLLSSLRDSENIFFDYAGEPYSVGDAVAGVTLPSTISGWLNSTGLYSTVSDQTGFVATEEQLMGLNPASPFDVILLVSSTFNSAVYPSIPSGIDPGFGEPHIPNHYVLVNSPFVESDDSVWLQMNLWSWGGTTSGWAGVSQFLRKYFGPIIATTY